MMSHDSYFIEEILKNGAYLALYIIYAFTMIVILAFIIHIIICMVPLILFGSFVFGIILGIVK